MHRPDALGHTQYGQLVKLVQDLVKTEGVVDLYGSPCYAGPSEYAAGNYDTPADRYRMWRLASYYLLKERPGQRGKVYFDPTFCIHHTDPDRALSFRQEWLSAYQVNIGQPLGAPTVALQGESGHPKCKTYQVWRREYSKGMILIRPKDLWSCDQWDLAVKVPLPAPLRLLKVDGSLTVPQESILLRNAEAAILVHR